MKPVSRRGSIFAFMLCATVALTGCDSSEERAEAHYQNSLVLLSEGDVERALIELRNVFDLNGLHREARLKYAEIMRDTGEFQQAYRHYLLLSEQFPDDPLPRKWLFRIAMIANDLEQAEIHGQKALKIAPEDPEVQAIAAVLDYQMAVSDEAPAERRDAAERLEHLAAEVEDQLLFIPTLVDNSIREGDYARALERIDALLARNETLEQWQQARLRVLTELGDAEAVVAQLERLIRLFPDNVEYPAALVQWHVAQGDPEAAEDFLRAQARDAEGEARFQRQIQLVGFISGTAGNDAAIEELERLIGETDRPAVLRSMRAGLLYERGDEEAAIAEMRSIVDDTEISSENENFDRLNDIEVTLARMLLAGGDETEARRRINAVLSRDSGHAGALKQNASWLIEDDRMDEAIVQLRSALGRTSDDPEIMTLLSDAHLRNGSRNLAREMLALAVESSGGTAEHAIDYAEFLMADRDFLAAENVLMEALRAAPQDTDLLALLGRLYVETADWSRAESVEEQLRRLGSEEALSFADGLRLESLRSQQRGKEALRFLTELAGSQQGSTAAEIAVAMAHMENGSYDLAEAFIEARLDETPDQPEMRMLLAALYAQTSRGEEADAVLRALVEEDPTRVIVWRTLYETKLRVDEVEEASTILDEALAAAPEAPDLLWAKAGELERGGDVDGAIGIYEALYERLPNSPIVANNLASLLSTHRQDPQSLERAYTIARRLRGSDVPAFQDTYGWIAHLRGDFEEAIEHLEPASDALPGEFAVQYHLGMAYASAGRLDDAVRQLARAIELGTGRETTRLVTAREELARLERTIAERQDAN